MPIFKPEVADQITVEIEGTKRRLLKKEVYEGFNLSILGLGDLGHEASATDAIAAIFDLQGFTNFCKQIEPHLSVPLFLREFLTWLMNELRDEVTHSIHAEGARLWCPLPFLVKFMGDGLLVLWDSTLMSNIQRRNVLISIKQILDHYKSKFLPIVRQKVVDPPELLRCGIARGTVYSVGNGTDFVGSCINMAARIQKLPGITFAFNRRGFDLEDPKTVDFFKKSVLITQVSIRGIGDKELIAILKREFDAMVKTERKTFRLIGQD